MNKKLIAAFIAVFLLLSCVASAFAVSGVGIGDIIGVISSIDASEYTKYNEQEWTTLTPAERAEQLNYVINHQKGTSHLNESSDLINDSAASFQAYDILTGNSSVGGALLGGDASSNMIMKIGLEQKGYADFGMGYYNSNGHSGGKFGDNTVADTLNDDFLDYIQKYPYVGQDTPSTAYKFSNGYYVDWDPLLINSASLAFFVDGVRHSGKLYGLRFYLHDETGKIIDMVDHKGFNAYTPLIICDICGGALFDNFTITYDGQYYFDYHPWDKSHRTSYFEVVQSAKYQFPWWSQYGAPTEEPVVTDPVATGTDENGNEIQFNINSDGVTYEGNTYNYNDDNSVTINGNTYHITVNPADVNDDYYNQFLQQVINNYYNYYGTDAMPFDSTDIIKSLQSIFNSLEKFRSDCYLHLKQISNYVVVGFNSMRSSLNSVIKRLDEIIKQLKGLGGMSDMTDEEYANYQKKLEAAVNARFLPVIELKDLVEKALEAYKNNSMSQINFDYNGRSYSIDFSTWFTSENLQAIRFLMAAFIYVSYAFNTFRRIPSYINNGGDK